MTSILFDEIDDDEELQILEADDASERISDDDIVYQINTFGADYTIDGLVKRFDRGDIFRPEFQRNFVWTTPQASRFIESVLLGLPIPSVFLYREESTRKQLIVDGLQRLTTLHAFSKGRFEHNDKVFRLNEVARRFKGRTFDDLEPEDQRRFDDSVIHVMVIQQIQPSDDNSSVFQIFDRLNSNGTPLQPQEIRAAIYHGPFQKMLGKLNQNQDWRDIFGKVHKRAKDQELILRFLALMFDGSSYEAPMKNFLNSFMRRHRYINENERRVYSDEFEKTITRINEALGRTAFRPQRSLNVAFYDAFMVAVAKTNLPSAEAIRAAHTHLVSNLEFAGLIRAATSDETNVERRIKLAIEAVDAAS